MNRDRIREALDEPHERECGRGTDDDGDLVVAVEALIREAVREALTEVEAAILSSSYSMIRAQQGPSRDAAAIVRAYRDEH